MSFLNGWKSKSPVVKGAIISPLVFLIFLILNLFFPNSFFFFFFFPGAILLFAAGFAGSFVFFIIFGLLLLVPYSLFGALLGLIYKKTKNKVLGLILVFLTIVVFIFLNLQLMDKMGESTFETYGSHSLSDCEGIKDLEKRNDCLMVFAFNSKDPLICERISRGDELQESTYSSCYYQLAIEMKNLNLCEKITERDSIYQDYENCYFDTLVAIDGGSRFDFDPAICDKIPESGVKQDCYSYVSSYAFNQT